MSLPRGVLAKVLLALASLLAVLGGVELGLRIAGFDPKAKLGKGRALPVRVSESEVLGYELRPDSQGHLWECDVTINSGGFRDREYAIEKPEGCTRIVALGDSITFGNHMTAEETWPKRLEQLLGTTGRSFEVLNFGVAGYDTAQEVELFERRALAYRPDHVLVCFCLNDVATVSVVQSSIRHAELLGGFWGWSRLVQLLLARDAERTLVQELKAQRIDEDRPEGDVPYDARLAEMQAELARLVAVSGVKDDLPNHLALQHLAWYGSAVRIFRVRQALQRLALLAREHGFQVHLFVVPFLDEGPERALRPAWTLTYAMIRREAERVGFHYLDLPGGWESNDLASLRIHEADPVHPNARGQRKIAVFLAKQLAELGKD